VLLAGSLNATGQRSSVKQEPIPRAVHVQILKAEDERRWDSTLSALLTDRNPAVRSRAALAAGRIGNEQSLPSLASLLRDDKDQDVRAMAAFAIGEVESDAGVDTLIAVIKNTSDSPEVRARAIEALGKIAAALPREKEARARELGAIILDSLRSEDGQTSPTDTSTILLGLTAALRSRPTNAGPVISKFLGHEDPCVRADAANALARLRLKDANGALRGVLTSDVDPVVRANAARVLGATEEKSAIDVLLDRSLSDSDSRVRVSAIRALASLKEPKVADSLLNRSSQLTAQLWKAHSAGIKNPAVQNELLEIITTLGRLLPLQSSQNKADPKAVASLFKGLRELIEPWSPEVETAYVRTMPAQYLTMLGAGRTGNSGTQSLSLHWRSAASVAQALGEVAALPDTVQNKDDLSRKAEMLLRDMLDNRSGSISIVKSFHPEYATSDILRALTAFKPKDLDELLRRYLNESDVVVRSTAADLIGDLPPSEQNTQALISALPRTQNDDLNDAALSILDSLAQQKTAAANEAIKSALQSHDPLVRRRAVSLLKTNGVGDFSWSIGTVKSRNTRADYERALARSGHSVKAIVTTSKGSFTIELLPNDAPLTVDNFVRLAQREYFRGITIHRVVPNFVIQDGDPRGDGNGGPGYQIRCEINQVTYERAAVGMALSGKDTGGSQWFVTHSRQPHLDGGYTVFGRVISGMNVVDDIVRGDIVQAITIRQR
jgi:cyclophilin family peptidyl-prolyl cis-trans isomerase/HEAT repeat protein